MKCIHCGGDNPDPQREMSSKGGKASRRKIAERDAAAMKAGRSRKSEREYLTLIAKIIANHAAYPGISQREIARHLKVGFKRVELACKRYFNNTGERIGHQPRRIK